MKKILNASLAVLCITGCMTGCVNQNDHESLQRRVQEQEQQLRQMQPAQADSWARLEALQQELNQMKGQLDDLQNAGGARAIIDKLNRHEGALRQVETSMAINLNLDPVNTGGAAVEPQPVAGGQLTPPAGILAGNQQATTPVPAQHQPVAPAPKDMASALFDAGKTDFTARRYKEAQRSFTDFIKTYKTHGKLPDAQYYVAECYFQQNLFADAALAYDVVISKYAKSAKAPASYLKQGICFSKLGQGAAAKARMQELIKKYPTSAEAARAKTFLKTNK